MKLVLALGLLVLAGVVGLADWTWRPFVTEDALGAAEAPRGRDSTFLYSEDPADFAFKVRDPNGVGVETVVDARGRTIQTTDTQGDSTTRTYDVASNVLTETDAKSGTVTNTYDAQGRRIKTVDRLGNTTAFYYDAAGNLIKIVDADAWDDGETYAENASNPHTLHTYDAAGRKIATTYPGHNPASSPGDSDYDKKLFEYDAAGRLVKSTDQKGDSIVFAFNLAGQLLNRKYYNAAGVLQDTDTLTYEGPRLASAAKGRYDNTVEFEYDNAGRTTSETLTVGGSSYEVGYGYDVANRLVELTYPDGTTVDRGYTACHQLDDVDYESAAVADRIFDDGGRLTQTTFGNSLVESRTFTRDDNMVTGIAIPSVTGFGYSYDANKNRTAQTDSIQTAHAWDADYDAEDRLADFDKNTYNQHDQTWSLSNEGDWNSTTLGGTQETRTHDDVHQLTQRGATNLSYDAKGNLTQDKNGRNFTWDQDNKLSAADLDGDETDDATYTYDALGRRVTKVYNSLTTLYARSGWQTLAEYENSGSGYQLARKFVYGDYVDEPLMMIRLVEEKKTAEAGTGTESEIGVTPAAQMTEQKYYYHANANYNIAAMTNQAGTVVEQYRYSAYGLPTVIQTANIGNPFYFTGKRYDAELAWYDYNFRPFEPEQGRFPVREDKYRDTINSYQYCNAAPLHKTDPTGKIIVTINGLGTVSDTLEHLAHGIMPIAGLSKYQKRGGNKIKSLHGVWVGGKEGGKNALKKAYEDFLERKKTDPCSLEQFVAIGHSDGATAIVQLLQQGAFNGKHTPAYLEAIS
jgi:RHS repeat-associated protein